MVRHVSLAKGATVAFTACSTTRHRVLLGIGKYTAALPYLSIHPSLPLSLSLCAHVCIWEGIKRTRHYSVERLCAERQHFKDDRCLLRANHGAVLWKEANLFPPSVCLTGTYQSRDATGARTLLCF